MYKKILFLPLCMVLFFYTYAQPTLFNKVAYYDDFDDSSFVNWKVVNTTDNLYLMEDGRYHLQRKNKNTADLVFCNWENTYNNFEVKMRFRFEPGKNKMQYVGFVFKAGKSEALLAEINEAGMARLRKIADGKSSYLTGTKKEEGWIKLNAPLSGYNEMRLQSDHDEYSILLNGLVVTSIKTESYPAGRIGLLIGANSNAVIDEFWVYAETRVIARDDTYEYDIDTQAVATNNGNTKNGNGGKNDKTTGRNKKSTLSHQDSVNAGLMSSAEARALQQKVYELQQQVNTYRNKMYKETDRADSLQYIFDHDGKKDYREENKRLTKENNALAKQNDSLYLLLQTYNDVRSVLNKVDGGEISVKLAEKLYQEKSQKEALARRNKELELQQKKLNQQIKSLQEDIDALKKAANNKKK